MKSSERRFFWPATVIARIFQRFLVPIDVGAHTHKQRLQINNSLEL